MMKFTFRTKDSVITVSPVRLGFFVLAAVAVIGLSGFLIGNAFSKSGHEQYEDSLMLVKTPTPAQPGKSDRNGNMKPYRTLHIKEDVYGYRDPSGEKHRVIPAVWHGGAAYLPIVRDKLVNGERWLKVMIQERPNESRLWVRFDDSMTIYQGRDVIDIDVSTGTLRYYHQRRLTLKASVVLGKASTPTPKGKFFVTHLAKPPDDSYGSFMLVTNAHSETIQDFGGIGDAIVAIHGPVDSSDGEIARRASLSAGCVRLTLHDLEGLRDVSPGTAVNIH